MKYYSISIFILITHLALFSGCQCREHQTGKYQFTTKELQINPYNINDRFILKSLSGDSVQYLVSGRYSSLVKAFGNSDECQRDYKLIESNVTSIVSADNIWKFSIILNSYIYYEGGTNYKVIGFDECTNPYQSNHIVASIGLLYKNDSIYDNHGSTSAPISFHKVMTLGTNSFSDIYEITLNLQYSGIDLWATKIFYSIKIGIVGFTTNKNETWYLDM